MHAQSPVLKRLPKNRHALSLLPKSLLPFNIVQQDRILPGRIDVLPRHYRRIQGDTEMATHGQNDTIITVSAVQSTNHNEKPTKISVFVTDFHREDKPDWSTYLAEKSFDFPINLAPNEYFVTFLNEPYAEEQSIMGERHSWVSLSRKSFVTSALVRFDHKGRDDQKVQGLKLTIAIAYRVEMRIPK